MISPLNADRLRTFDAAEFQQRRPFPWQGLAQLLTQEAFERLRTEFPDPRRFAAHQDRMRVHNQRPHNRCYLTLDDRRFGRRREAGQIGMTELSPAWRALIRALRRDQDYQRFAAQSLGTPHFRMRFDWHLAAAGQDVSPHCDDPAKAGTHLFYFNSSADWRPEWGGHTVFLGGKRTERMNPELAEFAEQCPAPMLDNQSAIFRNVAEAWHGVGVCQCPPGHFRRLFCVVFRHTTPWQVRILRTLRGRVPRERKMATAG